MKIQPMSAVLFVRDIQASRRFYEEVLCQKVELDLGLNVGFEGGFALWQADHAEGIVFGGPQTEPPGRHTFELYFETSEMDEACRRLAEAGVTEVHPLREQPWGQRVIRFYDPDRHVLEIGEPMWLVVLRFARQGLTPEEVAQRAFMPLEVVRQILENPPAA